MRVTDITVVHMREPPASTRMGVERQSAEMRVSDTEM